MTGKHRCSEPDCAICHPVSALQYEVRDLTDEEYEQTYASGDGGHKLPPNVLAELNGEMPDG